MKQNAPGFNHQSIKSDNRALVLKIIATEGPLSRVDLSHRTNLTKMAITNIVGDLIEQGLVQEIEKGQDDSASSVGRKAVKLDVVSEQNTAIGVYVARDSIQVTLCDIKGNMYWEDTSYLCLEESNDSFLERVRSMVSLLLQQEVIKDKTVRGIGVACIGPIDRQKGIILNPPNFHNLRAINIKDFLESNFHYPVYMDNDMNAAALAEKLFGQGRGFSDFVYVGITNGIGAGVVINDRLMAGTSGFGGEMGHMSIDLNGPLCPCGNNGCLELYASIPAMIRQAKEALALGAPSLLAKNPDSIHWSNIIEAAKSGDPLGIRLVDRLCVYISAGLVSMLNLFDPMKIIIGHDGALAGKLLTDRLEPILKQRALSSPYKETPVEIARFQDKSPSIGAASLVFCQLFNMM